MVVFCRNSYADTRRSAVIRSLPGAGKRRIVALVGLGVPLAVLPGSVALAADTPSSDAQLWTEGLTLHYNFSEGADEHH